MKKLVLSLIVVFSLLTASFSQIVNYDIPIGATVGLELTSGDICTAPFTTEEAKQVSMGNSWGGTWTSTNSGMPSSIQVTLKFSVSETPEIHSTTLNGTSSNNVDPTAYVDCASGPLLTWDIDPSNYNPLGSNTFLVDYSNSDTINQVDNLPYLGDPYIRVIVDYTTICEVPEVPTLSTGTPKICLGESATISTSGNLNDATEWFLYSGSCGGTLVDQNATGTFVVTPTITTDYFIRGEGGCVTPGSCETINIQVDLQPNNAVTQNGAQLTAVTTTATSYQWLDCDNNYAVISGATSQIYTATSNGNYAVEVSEFACPDTSACFSVTTIGWTNEANNIFTLYPNPVESSLTINVFSYSESIPFEIINSLGQHVYSGLISGASATINVEELPAGVYYVQVLDEEGKILQKFIKK